MQQLLYSHCVVGPGGPLAVPPPGCCGFSYFFLRPLLFSSYTSIKLSYFSFYSYNSWLPQQKQGYFSLLPCVKLRVFLQPYLFSGGMLVCWLPTVCSPAASSRHYPELSVELIVSVCFHMQHQIPLLWWWSRSTQMPLPRLLTTSLLAISVAFVLSMSNFSVYPPLFTPLHLILSTVLSLLPSLPPRSLHPSHFLSTHKAYQPPGLSPTTPLSTCIPPVISKTGYTPPPLPCACCSGGWVLHVGGQSEAACLISWGSGEQKMRGKGNRDRLCVC